MAEEMTMASNEVVSANSRTLFTIEWFGRMVL